MLYGCESLSMNKQLEIIQSEDFFLEECLECCEQKVTKTLIEHLTINGGVRATSGKTSMLSGTRDDTETTRTSNDNGKG